MSEHPRDILKPEWINTIREHAWEAEALGRLCDPVLRLIYDERWLQLLVPETCGGLEWPLPRVVGLFEALAWADGNAGWCVNLGAGANMFSGYLEENTAKAIFHLPRTWCAGSGATSGTATRVPQGYLVSGRWKYASGSAHATHFTANCILYDERGQVLLDNHTPVFRSIIVPQNEVTVYDTWKVTGLKATSSNDFSLDKVFVPDNHVFSLTSPSEFANGPSYRFPFDVMAVVNMACMATGIAFHFFDLFEELIARKKPLHDTAVLSEHPVVQARFETVMAQFYRARTQLYDQLEAVWQSYQFQQPADVAGEQALIDLARKAADSSRKVFQELFQLCGMDMVFAGSDLNKTWRDMVVASQHYLLGPLHV